MMDRCHLKGLRQILGLTTTYIDRSHTNQYVFAHAATRASASAARIMSIMP